MNVWIKFPERCIKNTKIDKSKIYEKASVSSKFKSKFVSDIDKIIWLYNLSASELNIEGTDELQEIQIFEIKLRNKDIDFNLLKIIDKAILSPVVFLLSYEKEYRYVLAYKKLSKDKTSTELKSSYLSSVWFEKDQAPESDLNISLSIKNLYFNLLKLFCEYEINDSNLDSYFQTYEKILKLESNIKTLRLKLSKQKQFNRKVEINIELQEKEQELNSLLNAKS